MTGLDAVTSAPSDAIVERLNDPAVAASLVTLLDNAELLSTLVLGLSGFLERGDYIMDAVAESVRDLKAAGEGSELPSPAELRTVVTELAAGAPAVQKVLNSPIVDTETIDLFSMLSEAATEGAATARAADAKVDGIRTLFRAFRDDDVQRGLGLVVEIARALGRRMA